MTGSQTGQFAVGTNAVDAVFTPDGVDAYVSNGDSNSISVVRISNLAVVTTISLGFSPGSLAITPDGKQVFVEGSAGTTGYVVAIDTASNTLTKTLALSELPSSMAVSPDGKKLYTNGSSSGLLTIDTQSLTVVATLPIYAAVGVGVTKDGRFAYVPNFGQPYNYTPNVAVVDTASNSIVTNIALNAKLNPSAIGMSPDGTVAYVGQYLLGTGLVRPAIAVIRISTNQVVGSIVLPPSAGPAEIVFAADSSRAYVADFDNCAIDVIAVAQGRVTAVIPTLGSTRGLALSPDGSTLLAPNSGTSHAAVVDSGTGAVTASIPVGDMGPSYLSFGGAAVSSDGKRAYVTNFSSGNVSVVDTASNTVVTSIPTGYFGAVGVVLKPDGSAGYIADQYLNALTVFDTNTFQTRRIDMPIHGYPTSLAIAPDGKHVYVTVFNIPPDFGQSLSYVFVIDTSTNLVVHTIIVPYPLGITISPDGSRAYVVSGGGRRGQSSLLTISTASHQIVNTLALEPAFVTDATTAGVVVTPDGTHVFADDAMSGTVWEIDATKNQIVKSISAGTTPGQLALSPDGSQVWAADYGSTSVSVIDVSSGAVVKTVPLGNLSYGVAFSPN